MTAYISILYYHSQGVRQAVFEIDKRFWAHKHWRQKFDELAKN